MPHHHHARPFSDLFAVKQSLRQRLRQLPAVVTLQECTVPGERLGVPGRGTGGVRGQVLRGIDDSGALKGAGPDNGPGRRYRPTAPAPSGCVPCLPQSPNRAASRHTHTHTHTHTPGWGAEALMMLEVPIIRYLPAPGAAPRCSPVKGWAGGRRPPGSSFPIPRWDRPGCGASAPPDLPAGASQVAGPPSPPPSTPTHGSGSVWIKVAPRDCTCAGPGGGRRIAGLSWTPPSTGRGERPVRSSATAAAAS